MKAPMADEETDVADMQGIFALFNPSLSKASRLRVCSPIGKERIDVSTLS